MRRCLGREWRRVFLETAARSGNVRLAAAKAGVDHGTVYNLRKRDARFAGDAARAIAWGQQRVAAGAFDPAEAAGPLVARVSRNQGAQLVRAGKGRWSGEAEATFLGHVAATGSVRRAAEAAGFSTTAVYNRRGRYPHFDARCRRAKTVGCEAVNAMLIEAAEAALDPEVDAAALELPAVSVGEAIAILRVNRFGAGGGAGARARSAIVKEEPPIEAVRDEVLRRIAAMRRHRGAQSAEGGGQAGAEGGSA